METAVVERPHRRRNRRPPDSNSAETGPEPPVARRHRPRRPVNAVASAEQAPQAEQNGTNLPPSQRRRRPRYVRKPPQDENDSVSASPVSVSVPETKTGGGRFEEMSKQLNAGLYQCMICIDVVRRAAAVYACPSCATVFHLDCAKRWGQSQSGTTDAKIRSWRCPNCQVVATKRVPSRYSCFCGQRKDPPNEASLPAHSCGGICGRKSCPHPCTLLCHAGPCPDCAAVVTVKCGCGRTQTDVRCHHRSEPVLCTSNCRRLLPCKRHTCRQTCHTGPCPPCGASFNLTCFCGQTTESRGCADAALQKQSGRLTFGCGKPCSKALDCGRHTCLRECHAGPCQPCQRTVTDPQPCACGKKTFPGTRQSCADPMPTCGSTCSKKLDCGHVCPKPCHDSDCNPCSESIVTLCRCGQVPFELTCAEYRSRGDDSLVCESFCNKLMRCGRHRCRQKCCPRLEHTCLEPCNKPLNCGIHQCELQCHSGNCPPCGRPIANGVSCACGETRILGPVPCGTPPPDCQLPCRRTDRACSHPCRYVCHPGPCPKCMILVKRQCAGQHVMLPAIACSSPPAGCGRPCGRPQPCHRHSCTKPCHVHPEDQPCQEKCNLVRSCGHPCVATCHGLDPCPNLPCKQVVSVTCPCGRKTKQRQCDLVNNGGSAPLVCDDQCEVSQRNSRFADALQIEPSSLSKSRSVPWTAHILGLAAADLKFVERLEKRLDDFVISPERPQTLYLESLPNLRLQLVRHIALQYRLISEIYAAAQGGTGSGRQIRLLRQGAASSVPPPHLLLSAVAQAYAKSPDSLIPKVTAMVVSNLPAVQLHGLVDCGPAQIQRLVSQWRQSYPVATRWIDSTSVIICCDSVADLKTSLAELDDAGVVYERVSVPSQSVFDQIRPSTAAATNPSQSVVKPKPTAPVTTSRRGNIWDALQDDAKLRDHWDQ